MARPKKQGLDYFQKNVDFYQDIKIRKLIRHKGIQAVSVYDILLCQIYRVGYYINWDDDLPFIISEISDLKEDNILDIINYALSIGLFDQTMYDEHQVLTSHGIQERFFDFCSVAKRKVSADLPYLLVDLSGKIVSSEKQNVISEETIVFPEETTDTSEETAENSIKSTQSKGKESKGKHSSSADIRAREEEPGVWSEADQQVYANVDEEVTALLSSPIWKEQVFMRFKFLNCNEHLLADFLVRWAREVKAKGKGHQHLGDAKSHFTNWMIIQEDKLKKNVQSYGTDNHNGYRSREDIDAGTLRTLARMSAAAEQPKRELPVV